LPDAHAEPLTPPGRQLLQRPEPARPFPPSDAPSVRSTATCHPLNLEPWAYLRHVLERLLRTPPEQLDALPRDKARVARVAGTAALANQPWPRPHRSLRETAGYGLWPERHWLHGYAGLLRCQPP